MWCRVVREEIIHGPSISSPNEWKERNWKWPREIKQNGCGKTCDKIGSLEVFFNGVHKCSTMNGLKKPLRRRFLSSWWTENRGCNTKKLRTIPCKFEEGIVLWLLLLLWLFIGVSSTASQPVNSKVLILLFRKKHESAMMSCVDWS